jgi:hypothetical protein
MCVCMNVKSSEITERILANDGLKWPFGMSEGLGRKQKIQTFYPKKF